jgi:hypothetical protein
MSDIRIQRRWIDRMARRGEEPRAMGKFRCLRAVQAANRAACLRRGRHVGWKSVFAADGSHNGRLTAQQLGPTELPLNDTKH